MSIVAIYQERLIREAYQPFLHNSMQLKKLQRAKAQNRRLISKILTEMIFLTPYERVLRVF